MGACYTKNKNLNQNQNVNQKIPQNQQPFIVEVKVSDVKPISEEEKENFIKTYLSDAYLHPKDEGYQERLKDSVNHMWNRWDWLQKNKETYVNMLRVKGFTDDNIQACLDGKRPLCFESKELHDEFCKDLSELRSLIEQETRLKNVSYIQTGSSVPGYSSNPFKGLPDQPSKITDISKSDVDVVVVAEGVIALMEAKRKEQVKVFEYRTVVKRGIDEQLRFGFRMREENVHLPKSLYEWKEKWAKKMGGGVQVTFQERGGEIAPWELPIPINKTA